jgi:hypothetical protein
MARCGRNAKIAEMGWIWLHRDALNMLHMFPVVPPLRLRFSGPFVTGLGVSVLLASLSGFAQTPEKANDGSRTLRVELDTAAKVRLGTAVRAHTVEPLFDSNELVIPAGTVLFGNVSEVHAVSKNKRASAISHGDFTALHEVAIQFNSLRLQNGSQIPIATAPAEETSQVVRFQSSRTKRPSLFRQGWNSLIAQKNQTISTVTAPGKTERLKKYVFAQLPWHPEEIDAGSRGPGSKVKNWGRPHISTRAFKKN